nr:MAG TPA: hypothetical protein [Caudoviricetes sp.]
MPKKLLLSRHLSAGLSRGREFVLTFFSWLF